MATSLKREVTGCWLSGAIGASQCALVLELESGIKTQCVEIFGGLTLIKQNWYKNQQIGDKNMVLPIIFDKKKIRIRTKKGDIVHRSAIVTEWINTDGQHIATAVSGNASYSIVDRDYWGPIFKASKQICKK